MSRDLIRQLKSLKHEAVNPREEWVKKNREVLFSQIKNTLPVKQEALSTEAKLENMWAGLAIFLPRPFVYNVMRPIAVLVLVATVVTTAYSGTVKASSETLPGDFLYPAKRTAERAEGAVISLIGDKSTETKYHVRLAERRASEAQTLVKKKDDPEKNAKVSATVQDLKNELNTINEKLDNNENKKDIQADVAKGVKLDTEAINVVLQDVKQELILSGQDTDKLLTKEVSETKNLVQDVSVKAVQVMVERHLDGDQSVSKEEVRQAIDNSINTAVTQVLDSKQTVDGAKTIMETMKTQVSDLAQEIRDTKLVTTTKEYTQKLTDVVSSTKDAVIKTQEASDQVDKKIIEARVLADNGELSKAVDKLKEVNTASKEAEKISDATIIKAQEVLPIVQVIKDVTTPAPLFTSTTLLTVSSTKDIISLFSSTTAQSTPHSSPTGTTVLKSATSTSSTVK